MSNQQQISIRPLGETAVIVQFGTKIDPLVNQKARSFSKKMTEHPFDGLIECVPAFASVTVFYNPYFVWKTNQEASPSQVVMKQLEKLASEISPEPETAASIVEIPVCYGGKFGPDLEFVAKHSGLSAEEVIFLHSSARYPVYMIGFAPGFPYLGGLSEKLYTPRRLSPRQVIPAGSVGIAGGQTGVYPIATPGGWQLIGRTPKGLFRPHEPEPSLLSAGDTVKFTAITKQQFEEYEENNL